MSNGLDKAKGSDVWKKIMSAALGLPGVKVDRESFLASELARWCDSAEMKEAIDKWPHAVLSTSIIDRVAKSCIRSHLYKVSLTSAVAGLPGGLALFATVPADVAQYYWHTLVLSQKLAYLYGWPDLCDENGNLTDTAFDMLTVFIGVMMGAAVANRAIREIAQGFAGQVVKRLPRMALTRGAVYPLVKQVAKWIGVKVTTVSFAKSLGKAIPVISSGISGSITYVTFSREAERLRRRLHDDMKMFVEPEGEPEEPASDMPGD